MISRLIQWMLSKLIPYNGVTMVKDPIISVGDWDKCKFHENEEFYGGNDGTRRS